MAKPLTSTEVVALIAINALIVAALAYIGFAIWAEPIAKVSTNPPRAPAERHRSPGSSS
jgi:hypothetical protein